MERWDRRERWGHDPLAHSPVAVAGIPPGRIEADHTEVRSRNGSLEGVDYR